MLIKILLLFIYLFFVYREVGLWLGGEGAVYQCGSLEVLEASVYVKWPILFSAFNMMSD